MKKNSLEYLYSLEPSSKKMGGNYFQPCLDTILMRQLIHKHLDWAEFGTGYGVTTRWLWNYMKIHFKNIKLYTFDWFKGLPEDWAFSDGRIFTTDSVYRKGHLAASYPKWLDDIDRIIVYNGLFEDTLPKFREDHKDPLGFVNIDCDIYSSTKTVLENINEMIIPGTIIYFDEYYNYDIEKEGWKEHEYKAFQEFCQKYDRDFEYLGRSVHWSAWVKMVK